MARSKDSGCLLYKLAQWLVEFCQWFLHWYIFANNFKKFRVVESENYLLFLGRQLCRCRAVNITMVVLQAARECRKCGRFSIWEYPNIHVKSPMSQTQSCFKLSGMSHIVHLLGVDVDTANWNIYGHTVDVAFCCNLHPCWITHLTDSKF